MPYVAKISQYIAFWMLPTPSDKWTTCKMCTAPNLWVVGLMFHCLLTAQQLLYNQITDTGNQAFREKHTWKKYQVLKVENLDTMEYLLSK